MIGHLAEEKPARTFGDYLYLQKIESHVEFEKADGWGIWINDEDKLEEAARLLKEFQGNPSDPKYRAGAKSAAELRAEAEKGEAKYRKKVHDRRVLFQPLAAYGFGPVTAVLILISVVVFLLSKFGRDFQPIMGLFITNFAVNAPFGPPLPEVMHGQVWRLITPIFIHFGLLHIFFNMWWLRDLGSMIEARQSSRLLVVLVLVIAACSNLAQYLVRRAGVRRHVRRGVRPARLYLDAREVRSGVRLVPAPYDGDDDDHLVLPLLHTRHPQRGQRHSRRRLGHGHRLGLPLQLALPLTESFT